MFHRLRSLNILKNGSYINAPEKEDLKTFWKKTRENIGYQHFPSPQQHFISVVCVCVGGGGGGGQIAWSNSMIML